MRKSLVLLSAFLIFGFASCDNGTTNGVTNNWGNWIYSEWTVTTPATTDTEGVETRTRTRTCYNTGQVQTENQTRAIAVLPPVEYSLIGEWRASAGGVLQRIIFTESSATYYYRDTFSHIWNIHHQFTSWNINNNTLTLIGDRTVTATFSLSQQELILSAVTVSPADDTLSYFLERTLFRYE